MSLAAMSATTGEAAGARSAASPRRERMRVLLRSGTFMAGVVIVGFWVDLRALRQSSGADTIPMPTIS